MMRLLLALPRSHLAYIYHKLVMETHGNQYRIQSATRVAKYVGGFNNVSPSLSVLRQVATCCSIVDTVVDVAIPANSAGSARMIAGIY